MHFPSSLVLVCVCSFQQAVLVVQVEAIETILSEMHLIRLKNIASVGSTGHFDEEAWKIINLVNVTMMLCSFKNQVLCNLSCCTGRK